jgi:glycine cleavage system transcriptional repressor
MEQRFIMTAFGKDRPGIVADVTQLIYESGCNLEDSEMTRLSDEFAMILLFSGNADGLEDKLTMGCRRLEIEKGLSAYIRSVPPAEVQGEKEQSVHTLSVEGFDQAGIMYKVSRFLAQNSINIIDLRSKLTRSAESGQPFYTIKMMIEIPEGTALDRLDQGLAEIEEQLHIDIRLE